MNNLLHSRPARTLPARPVSSVEPPVIELLRGFPTRLFGAGHSAFTGLDMDEAERRIFLCVLEAMTHPGRIVALPRLGDGHPRSTGPLAPATAALLRTLLEPRSSLWHGPGLDRRALRDWLLQHSSADLAQDARDATFVLTSAAHAHPQLWRRELPGHPPDRASTGPTLLIEVPRLWANPPAPRREPGDAELSPRLRLSVPGLARTTRLAAEGLGRHFWRERMALQAPASPWAVELILICGDHIAAIPRAACVMLED